MFPRIVFVEAIFRPTPAVTAKPGWAQNEGDHNRNTLILDKRKQADVSPNY